MPTTTRSSDGAGRPEGRTGAPRRRRLLALLFGLGLVGCASRERPVDMFQLSAEAPQYRATQTRWFETRDADELLSASAAVLQDLGFHVEESVRGLGFLKAAKERSAREHGQEIGRVLLWIVSFFSVVQPTDLEQKIGAALVARPLDAGSARHEVRISFYRVVWKGDGMAGREAIPPGEQRMEMIRDPLVYQQFFAKLAKAVFLEAHKL